MNNTIKTTWNNKHVHVNVSTSYMVGEKGKTLFFNIKVEDTVLLPSSFTKGAVYRANPDIINSMGGLWRYVKKILDDAAKREEIRRNAPIEQQLALDF